MDSRSEAVTNAAATELDPLRAAFPGPGGAPTRALIAFSRALEERGVLHGPLPPLRAALGREIEAARAALDGSDLEAATRHAGRVHVLGSFYAVTHAYSHWVHLRVDLRRRDWTDAAIQAVRLVGTAFTRPIVPFIGVTGHPGTSNRAAGTRWPIEPELQALLDAQPRPERS
ncbi:MAG TPA: DUF3703 domain-containing protein [Polyangiaceae bacterium]